jgi:PPM family protein phosphatase
MIVVEAAGQTDVGKKRKGNEDTLYLDDDLKIYVVADGMGGHQAGEVASGLVVRTIQDYMQSIRNNDDAEELVDIDQRLSKEANRLLSSIHLGNRVVFQKAEDKPGYKGMGSTVSAVFFTDHTAIAANVGDSPIYLIRGDEVSNLSVPHTVIAEQMAINPDAERQLSHKFKHMLTRAMGIERTVEPDTCEIQCFKDDVIVIASDGLTDKVPPEEIRDVVREHPPQGACQSLIDLANHRGGDDNITVIVLKVAQLQEEKGGLLQWIARLFK